MSRMLRAAGLCSAVTVLLTCLASPAAADNSLVSSTPPHGSTLKALPQTITLTFAETLDANTTTVTVKGPSLETLSGQVRVDGMTATVPVTPGPDGPYRVNFRVVSVLDGHAATGSVHFTVGDPAAAPSESPVAAASHDPAAVGGGWWVWVVAGAITALAGAVAALAIRRNRRRRTASARA